MKKKRFIVPLVIALLVIFSYLQNNWIGVTQLELRFHKLPDNFDGYKIIQLSDLHSKWFGRDQSRLVTILEKSKPDLIVVTGDLIDSNHYEEQSALKLVKKAVEIAPVYYVTGNHEWWSEKFISLENRLNEAGVIVLRNTSQEIAANGQKIHIAGIDDPASAKSASDEDQYIIKTLESTLSSTIQESFKILLSHRPEKLFQYSSFGVDLVFSGHAHGGQFRFPFIGGLVAPDQGYLPKYTSGVHNDKATVMVISRGLGNSIIPQRIFNRPEVIEVTLKSKQYQ